MNTSHVTMAAPHGMRGDKRCPAERIGAPERVCLRRSVGGGTLAWAVVAGVLVASTVAFGQDTTSLMFGIDNNSDLWLLEPPLGGTSGTASLQLSSPVTKGFANGLAYDSVRDQLFVVDRSNYNFWWLGSGSASFTSLGNISAFAFGSGKPGQVVSAAYFNDAYWFLGSGSTGNLLGKVSLSYTGDVPAVASGTTFTIVGMPTTASGGGDMVITSSGMLYAYSAPFFGNFFTANVTTAASGTVGGYGLINTTSGTGLQLALGVDGTTLYGTDGTTGLWYTVDTSNGSLTQVPGFTTVGFNDLAGSAPGTPVIPEPSTWCMAVAGLACGGFAMRRRRRTRG